MRYFYTDPLAAAWMAKHFGVAIESTKRRGIALVPQSVESMAFHAHTNLVGLKYYLAPESVQILDRLRDDQVKALGILNLWPESE